MENIDINKISNQLEFDIRGFTRSFVHRTVTEGCKVINTTHRIPILFHYDISLKHTFSQILQQDEFFNSTKTKIKTTSCQILPLATIPTQAPMPTGVQIPHRLRSQLCLRPLETSQNNHNSKSHFSIFP